LLVRLPPLRLGLGRDQVSESFNRSQIHAAIFEGAPRELPCFRMTKAWKLRQRGKDRRDHCAASVHMQFSDVFAGFTVRAGKPQRQPFIDDVTGRRIAHVSERRASRLRHATDQLFECDTRTRTGNANNCDCRRRPPRRKGKDRIAMAHTWYSDFRELAAEITAQ
jgi:hypothetical protein